MESTTANPTPPGPAHISDWLSRNLVLVVLSAGCIVMALLTLEQDRTIASQRELIRSLFHDSVELNALKLQQQNAHRR